MWILHTAEYRSLRFEPDDGAMGTRSLTAIASAAACNPSLLNLGSPSRHSSLQQCKMLRTIALCGDYASLEAQARTMKVLFTLPDAQPVRRLSPMSMADDA
jgi:hypothetical protein